MYKRQAEYHALNQRLWQQYNSGEIDATHLQQTRFSLFAEQVNVAPMAMNETFLQQIIALSVPLEGVEETLQTLKSKVRMGIITNGFSLPQRGRCLLYTSVPETAGAPRPQLRALSGADPAKGGLTSLDPVATDGE